LSFFQKPSPFFKFFVIIILAPLPFILLFIFSENNHHNAPVDVTEKENQNLTTSTLSSTYDLVVIGGEPEGIACAVNASRSGLKTVLIEKRDKLGGLFTYGMLNFLDLNYQTNGKKLYTGFFKEFHKKVGGRNSFDVKEAEKIFEEMTESEPNLKVMLNTEVEALRFDDKKNNIREVTVKHEGKTVTISSSFFIDATADADFAAAAGVPFTLGQEDIGRPGHYMAATFMLWFENISWSRLFLEGIFTDHLGGAKVNRHAAWGFAQAYQSYQPQDPSIRLRGLNIGRQNDDSVLINALLIFGVNPLDPLSVKKGIERGKKETDNVLTFLQENLFSFNKAEIAGYPRELYVRESRHIIGEYRLRLSDVFENKDFWDRIALASYPADVHATSPEEYGWVYAAPSSYAIPFRSIVPLKIDNLLVVGRSASFDSLAAGSARVVPTGMTVGAAAGIAASIALEENLDFRTMSRNEEAIKKLQEKIIDSGENLHPLFSYYNYQNHWAYPALKELLNWGLISGGLKNNFELEKNITEKTFFNIIAEGIKRKNPSSSLEPKEKIWELAYQAEDKPLTSKRALYFILKLEGKEILTDEMLTAIIKKEPWWNETLETYLFPEHQLNQAEAYYLAGTFLKSLTNETWNKILSHHNLEDNPSLWRE